MNSLDMLKAENIISDVRVIQDFQRFDDANLRLTEFAKRTYGLAPTPGELLYSVSDKKVNGNVIYRAEPNELLFSVLDGLIDEQETKLLMQKREASNEDDIASFMREEPKEGVKELFDNNPELVTIGTQEQYTAYLNSIFPESTVKDIVYHDAYNGDIVSEGFLKERINQGDGLFLGDGFYFYFRKNVSIVELREEFLEDKNNILTDPDYSNWEERNFTEEQWEEAWKDFKRKSQGYSMSRKYSIPVIVNVKKTFKKYGETYNDIVKKLKEKDPKFMPSSYYSVVAEMLGVDSDTLNRNTNRKYIDIANNFPVITKSISDLLNEKFGYDSVNNQLGNIKELLVFEPEQIHILGSEQDIEGFRRFVNDPTGLNVFENIDLSQTEYYGENNESVPVMVDGIRVGDISYGLSGNYAVINFANIPDEYKKSGVLKNAVIELGETLKADGLTLVSDALDPLTNMVWAELIMDNQAHINEDLVYAYGEGPMNMGVKSDMDIERSAVLGTIFAQKLSESMKTPYQQITREEASRILKNSPIKYNGEPAFYYAGTVYFIEGGLTLDTALHEFSHPLIAAIRRDNSRLFDNLYDQLMGTDEGQMLKEKMARLYPELPEGSVLYKEEMLVHALSKRATNQIRQEIETDGFSRFIRNLLYAIKQALKGIFGRVDVADINANTTLDQLAQKVLTQSFEIASKMTDEEVAQFARAEKARINKLDNTSKDLAKNISADAMIAIINDFFFRNKEVLDVAKRVSKKSPQYKVLEKAMFENEGQRLIKDVQASVRKFQTVQISAKRSRAQIVDDTVDAEIRRLQELTLQATTVVYSFSVINNVMDNIYDSLNDLIRSGEYTSRQGEKLLAVFNSTVTAYGELIKDTDDLLVRDFAMKTDNPFAQMLSQTNTTIQRSKNLITKIKFERATEFYKEYTQYMNDFVNKELKQNLDQLSARLSEAEIDDLYERIVSNTITDEEINALKDKNLSAQGVGAFIDHFRKYRITEERIRGLLSGTEADASWFNRMLEAYTSSNDPIVGAFAIFVNDIETNAMQEVMDSSEVFRQKLEPLLKAVGYNPNKTRQILELTTFEDEVFHVNSKGEGERVKVYTLQNEHKGYRADRAELAHKFEEAKETGDRDKIKDSAAELRKLSIDYLYDMFLPEVYKADEVFDTPIGRLAWIDRQTALDNFAAETDKYSNEMERFESYSTAQAAWKGYQQLFELNYIDGTPKFDDPATGRYDLSKAMLLREYRDKNRKYYEFVEVPGSLERAYNEFANLLDAEGVKRDGPEWKKRMSEWDKQNIMLVYAQEYYDAKVKDIERLKVLQAKQNVAAKETFNLSEAYGDIFELIYAFKDEKNQPVPSELGVDRLKMVKELQQKINDFKNSYNSKLGLTREQLDELEAYREKVETNEKLSPAETKRFVKLSDMQSGGLTATEHAEMTGIFNRLSELSSKVPTEYYMDALNHYLVKMGLPEVKSADANDFINGDQIVELLEKDKKFSNWFTANHVTKTKYEKQKGKRKAKQSTVYERLMAYSVSVPSNPEHLVITKVKDRITGKDIEFRGKPNARHSKYQVKDEFRTIPLGANWDDYVGIYVDNEYQFLPRPYDLNDPNSAVSDKYVNQEYLAMKNANSSQFKLIELLKEFHHKNQEDLPRGSKLWNDMPRFGVSGTLESIQGGKYKNNLEVLRGSIRYQLDKSILNRKLKADEYESNANFDVNQQLVTTDLQGNQLSYIPISGLYNIPINEVSPNIIDNLMRYQTSAKMQTKLIDTVDLAKGILETLEDNPLKQPNKFDKKVAKLTGKLKPAGAGKSITYNRLEQFRALFERTYHGRQVVGVEESNPWLHKLINGMTKAAGRATLAVNIPSDLKNRYGQVMQNIIESTGGEYVSLQSYFTAQPWVKKTMIEWATTGIYTKGGQSLSVQLIQRFDPFFKAKEEHGRSITRTMAKDLLDGSWMYDFRKFGEMEAAMQLFGGFMHHKYLDMKTASGVVPIRYIDAWELDENGIITLKQGIDPEWGNREITHEYIPGETLQEIADKYSMSVEDLKAKNSIREASQLQEGQELIISKAMKFKQFRNQFQAVSRRLYGAYDSFGQAEGNKYLAYRLFFFMRKWATPGFVNRFGMDTKSGNVGGYRYDWALGKPTRGYYIGALAALKKMLTYKSDAYLYMTAQEKVDLKRTIGEGVSVLLAVLGILLLFGYDDDDEARWEKIRARSGPAFTPDFQLRGYMVNHMLFLMMGVKQETSTFMPIPGLGLNEYAKFIGVTSPAFGSTLKMYVKIIDDLASMLMGNDSAYYKKDTGPYSWQQEGAPKVITHFMATFGLSGRTGDAETLIKNMEKYSSRPPQ
jgi:hypothetical protein